MDWISLLSTLTNKIKVMSSVIALSFVALYAIFFNTKKWCLLLVFCTAYILVEFIVYMYSLFIKLSQKRKAKKEKEKEYIRKDKENKIKIFCFFKSLSDYNLELLIDIYNEEYDSSDKYVRIIKEANSNLFCKCYESSNICNIPLYNDYQQCLMRVLRYNDSLIVEFDRYLYSLIENYANTGIKKYKSDH